MAHLKRVHIGGKMYLYIVKSVRSGDKVSKKVLEYLGGDVDRRRLRRALDYWGVKTRRRK